MRRILVVLGVLILVMSPQVVTAVGGKPWAPTTVSGSRFQSTWRTSNDSQSFYANVKWDSAARASLYSQYASGRRYTQEFNDTYLNLHATGRFATTFLNPSYDTDDDNGDWSDEEAEVTSKSTSFPQVNENYYAEAQFSHWYLQCGGGCGDWIWDQDSGVVSYLSQLSIFQVTEWNAQASTTVYKTVSYPFQTAPAGATISRRLNGPQANVAAADVVVVDGIRADVQPDGAMLDVIVAEPSDLSQHLRQNAARAARLSLGEAAEVVLTFRRPLSADEFTAVAKLSGVTLRSFEAIGLDADAAILTIGAEADFATGLAAEYSRRGARLDGIVAAFGTVANRRALQALTSNSEVYLVDVTPAFLKSELPSQVGKTADRLDVLVNDVYWRLAGLD